MAKTQTVRKEAAALTLMATCPHCGFSGNPVPGDPMLLPSRDGAGFDNGHNGGAGGYVVTCESCVEPFVIARPMTTDAQHACLILLGEA